MFWNESAVVMSSGFRNAVETAIARPSPGGGTVDYLRIGKTDVVHHELKLPIPAVYAAVASLSSGAVAIAYVAADTLSASATSNAVFAAVSRDSGRTWGHSTMLSTSGNHPSVAPTVLADARGRFHVVWAQSSSGELAPDRIRQVTLDPSGAPQDVADDLLVGTLITNLHAVISSDGRIHAVYQATSAERPVVEYSVWEDRRGWSTPADLSSGKPARDPALTISDSGRIGVSFAQLVDSTKRFPRFRSVIATADTRSCR